MTDYIFASYVVDSFVGLDHAAAAIAGEQSTGTFVEVPGESADLKARYAAEIRSVQELEAPTSTASGALPGAIHATDAVSRRGRVVISFPMDNIGPSIANLLTAIAGNLFELRELSGIRLVDLELPPAFLSAHPGPLHGISGTRAALGGAEGPLLGSIVKPSVGLTPTQLREVVDELASAKVDFIKDDELMNDPPYSPFTERVQAVQAVLQRQEDATSHRVMYAFNITGDMEDMLRRLEVIEAADGTCAMVVVSAVGLPTVEYLRRRTPLVLHAHRAGFGAVSRHQNFGLDFQVFQQLVRLAGADHLHTNGFHNKFYETDDQIERSVRAVLAPLGKHTDTVPVLSSGQSAVTVPQTWQRLQTFDLLMLAGGGIHGHRHGATAGVESIRAAWRAVTNGIPLASAAEQDPSLAAALAQFGDDR